MFIEKIKQFIFAVKSAFSVGAEIGRQGRHKDFLKSPFKTMEAVGDEQRKERSADRNTKG